MRCPSLKELPPPPTGRRGWPWTADASAVRTDAPACGDWPRISVVTPSLNQAPFLEETIRSVLLQGYPDLEYIVLDGGSTDRSVEIIEKYEPWLAYWRSRPDAGQTRAVNEGWARSTGEILAYVNADDAYLPGALAIAASQFSRSRAAGLVYGTALIVDEDDRLLREWSARPFDARSMLTFGNVVPQPAAFFSAAAVRRVGGLNDAWDMIMDYDLCFRVGIAFPTVCLEQTLAKFRTHGQSKTHTRFEAMARELMAFIRTLDDRDLPGRDWALVKRLATSRIHYELAFGYAHYARDDEGGKALGELLRSALCSPRVVARNPRLTAEIARRAVLSLAKGLANAAFPARTLP